MSRIVGLLWLAALIWLVPVNLVHAASPVIKDFSSIGGHPANKDNVADTICTRSAIR
ncbi:MAG: hypothetical protein KAV00_02805 [Phycisphaerae bacterium]|nr:hypothetical protein [Phycisphaerae bacterium]